MKLPERVSKSFEVKCEYGGCGFIMHGSLSFNKMKALLTFVFIVLVQSLTSSERRV